MKRNLKSVLSLVCMASLLGHFLFSAGPLVADDVLKSEHGAALKVIIQRDTAVFAEPNTTSRSKPIRQFSFYFVLPADSTNAETKDGFYRVATGLNVSTEFGWVKADDAVRWPHMIALGFEKRDHRELVQFFADQSGVTRYLNKGVVSDAISREPALLHSKLLLPLLEQTEFDFLQERTEGYRVAYLLGRPATEGAADEPLTMDRIKTDLMTEICIVLDLTGSMSKTVDAMKDVIRELATKIKSSSSEGRFRLALVGYRDVGDEFTSKVYCDLEEGADLERFLNRLREMTTSGGDDHAEQVGQGIATALGLDWGSTSNRHVILIGDAPNQSPEKALVSIESILTAAQPDGGLELNNVVIHALQVSKSGEVIEDFTTLAKGRKYPGLFSLSDKSADFAEKFAGFLDNRMRQTEILVEGREVDFDEVKNDPNAGPIAPILEAINDEIDMPEFREGWCASVDNDGNRAIAPYVLVSKPKLKAFNASLELLVAALQSNGEPGSKDVGRILEQLQTITVAINYDGQINAQTKISEILTLALGLPVRSSVFDITVERLAQMNQAEFETWLIDLDSTFRTCEGLLIRSDNFWFALGDSDKEELRFAFIRVSDLP